MIDLRSVPYLRQTVLAVYQVNFAISFQVWQIRFTPLKLMWRNITPFSLEDNTID